jgi:hypothetical protein
MDFPVDVGKQFVFRCTIFSVSFASLRFLSRQIVDVSIEQPLQVPYLFVLVGGHRRLALQLDEAV